jgi:hypothetical protein
MDIFFRALLGFSPAPLSFRVATVIESNLLDTMMGALHAPDTVRGRCVRSALEPARAGSSSSVDDASTPTDHPY